MRFVILDVNNIVVNVVIAEEQFGLDKGWIPSDTAGIGWQWVEGTTFLPPVEIPTPSLPNHITVGALKDRMGMDALAISVSDNPICIALKEMLYDRKFVDLDRPQVGQFFDMLILSNQPQANALFPGSGPMTTKKKEQYLSKTILPIERP